MPPKEKGESILSVKGVTAVLVLVGLIIGGWWAVTEKLASAGELRQETTSRIGADYELRYTYDKLDIQRQTQDAERRIVAIQRRASSDAAWPTDLEDKEVLRAELLDLRAQKRDLDAWYRTATLK